LISRRDDVEIAVRNRKVRRPWLRSKCLRNLLLITTPDIAIAHSAPLQILLRSYFTPALEGKVSPCLQSVSAPNAGTLFRHPLERGHPATPQCVFFGARRALAARKPSLPKELRSWRTQGAPSSSALRLCRPSLRSPSVALRGRNPPLAFATLAGVGLGQGVFVSKHSTAIQKRRNHP